jgi:hypothetical protein
VKASQKRPGTGQELADETNVERFYRVLVESIVVAAPAYLEGSFTVAEIYQSLVPYRTHRDRLGVAMNGDYEDVLLRLLAGEGDFLVLDSEAARDKIRKELSTRNPNTGIYREFAAVGVRLNPARLPTIERPSEGPTPRPETAVRPASAQPDRKTTPPPETRGAAPEARPSLGDPRVAPLTPPPTREPRAQQSRETAAPEKCPGCSSRLPERPGLQFCPFCGTNIRVVPCRKCGEVLDRSWRFCVACGTPSAD